MGFLDQSHYDVVLVQETKLRVDSEYVTSNWICVGSGTESQKQAGVMVMIRKAITNVAEVRHDAVIPGRLLRVRFTHCDILYQNSSVFTMILASLGFHACWYAHITLSLQPSPTLQRSDTTRSYPVDC